MVATDPEAPTLQAFDFSGEPVRVIDQDGQPWFVAADVCQVLEIQQPTRAVESLEEDEKGVSIVHTPGGPQESIIISESGLYALIFRSRKEKAKTFRRWVTSEVLPAIRRTGAYSLAASFSNPPAPVEHPAVQFISVLDAIRARGASTEKALYSIGNLFQSSLAGAYQSNRQVLPMVLPPPPDPTTLPRPSGPRSQGSHARFAPRSDGASSLGAEQIAATLEERGPLSWGALQKAADLDANTMRNAMRRLRKEDRISQNPETLTWNLNEKQP